MPEKCIKDHEVSADASVAHQAPNQTKTIKMKSMILVALALVAVVAAAPVDEPIPIVRSNNDAKPDGGYQYGYETGNGITREEVGDVKPVLDEENKTHDVVVVRGSYSYTSPDGTVVTIEYNADEFGYHAQGDSIPKVARR